jgi:hypothetical protein
MIWLARFFRRLRPRARTVLTCDGRQYQFGAHPDVPFEGLAQ